MLSCTWIFWIISVEMDTYSLEDEGNEMFITQKSNDEGKMEVESDGEFDDLFGIGDVGRVSKENAIIHDGADSVPHYSDITYDEEVFEKPSFK